MEEKKSYINPIESFPLDNIPPDSGNDFKFLYWDDEVTELIRFNSIDDTHRPEDHIL